MTAALVKRSRARGFALAISLLAGATGNAYVQRDDAPFPSRPLRLITGFLPGGVSDTVARIAGEHLGQLLGQRVVIDGRPGAGGLLSMELAAHATPDGHTLYLGQPVITISPNFKRKPAFDPLKAFAPVSLLGVGATMLVLNPSTPANSVKELIALGKSQPPGTLRYGHSGQGSTNHLAGALFAVMAGVSLTPVPYKGAAANILAAMQGEVQMAFMPVLASIPHVKSGKLKGLAITGSRRSQALPDVPTIAETLPGYDVPVWYGLMVPAATPQKIVDRLNRETRRVLLMPEVREKLAAQGIDTQYTTQAEFAELIRQDAARWARLVRESGIVLE